MRHVMYQLLYMRQMMSRIPGMLVLCEADAMTSLGQLSKRQLLPRSEYLQLLTSCVRLLCKPDDRYSAVFVKGRPSATGLVHDIVLVSVCWTAP